MILFENSYIETQSQVPENVTLFEDHIAADAISEDEVIPEEDGPLKQCYWHLSNNGEFRCRHAHTRRISFEHESRDAVMQQ